MHDDVDDGLLRRSAVAQMFACSAASVDRLEERGIIPARRALSGGRVGWVRSECVDALRALPVGRLTNRTAGTRTAEARAKAAATRAKRRDEDAA